MQKLFLPVIGVGLMGILTGCGDLDSAAETEREEQLNRAAHIPGFASPDADAGPQEQSPLQHVPGQY